MTSLLALIILVPGLGTTSAIYRIPEGGGLADGLVSAGHRVIELDEPAATLDDRAAQIRLAAREKRSEPGPVFVVGLDLGGTAALLAAKDTPAIARVVLIASPVAFGGASRGAQIAFSVQSDTDWMALGKLGLQGPNVRRSLVNSLLTDGLPERIHRPLRERGLGPISRVTLRELRQLSRDDVPRAHAAFSALKSNPSLEVLVVTSMSDGLFPPWQCDPAAFGLRRENIVRQYFTRANDRSREYNHLDLLLHPAALGEVHPAILEYLSRDLPR